MAGLPEYIPCGAHYYRPPSPLPGEWEKDLKAMKARGFNFVQFWAMWRWQNPDEGVYQFSELDRLMDLAGGLGLKVGLSLKHDNAPAWVIQKFPEATLKTVWGRTLGPQDTAARQIGGVGCACLNHDASARIRLAFIRETVKRYRKHPALAVWNSWGEPDLGQSLVRMVGRTETNLDFLTCYCDSCQSKFLAWLETRYRTIAELNAAWAKNYRRWQDVETPVSRDTFTPMTDWRHFHMDRMCQANQDFMAAVRADDAEHPVMIHTHSPKYFDLMSTAVDIWRMAEPGDLHGATLTDDPFACDLMRSAAKGKPLWSSEIHATPGMTMFFPYAPTARDIKFFTFVPLAAGFTGFQYWQYRPELLGREAPAWGLTKPDGSETPWLSEVEKNFRVLIGQTERVRRLRRQPAEIALLWSPDCQLFSWLSYGSEYFYYDSLQGLHLALYEQSLVTDLVHPKEIAAGILKKYKVLLAAMPMYLEPELLAAVKEWVAAGGTLIAESHWGAVNPRDGRWQTAIPGFGFHEVFGCRQDLVRARRDWNGERAELLIKQELPGIAAGQTVHGMICEETLLPAGAEVLAEFAGGEAAVTRNAFGQGQAVYIGTVLGHEIWKNRGENEMQLLRGLVGLAPLSPQPRVHGGKVRADLLTDDQGGWLIVSNLDKKHPAEPHVWLPAPATGRLRELFSGEEIALEPHENGVKASVSLGEGEIKVFDLLR
ncbi:MAG: beta-galactosidase [candidate division FCPU426 bacterium]